jgi:cbb3-type cytochrome oxidase subunit 1
VRLVGEVNGESVARQRPNNSALFGIIWQPTSRNVFLDAGVRHGISSAAPDWQFTVGLTFGVSLAPARAGSQ